MEPNDSPKNDKSDDKSDDKKKPEKPPKFCADCGRLLDRKERWKTICTTCFYVEKQIKRNLFIPDE